jgi:hypothetical protein
VLKLKHPPHVAPSPRHDPPASVSATTLPEFRAQLLDLLAEVPPP